MTGSKSSIVMLALLVAWCLAVASRNAWTPDEPRELALSASQVEHFTALPTLGGIPFAEKPPLAYWVSGGAMRLLGVSGAAARAPLLIYALMALVSMLVLARRLGTAATGVTAALVFSTAWLVFNAQTWLAPDALLLSAVTLSLLGMHMAFGGEEGERNLYAGCAWMHLGLLLALFTKNFAGWLVPVSTLLTWLFFERRLRMLWHPAAWLPALGSLALLVLWARSVEAMPGGAARIHALFWDNLAGRLASFTDSSNTVRALGHRNWPGKYLVELPLYLLPWTALAVGAVVRLWRDRQVRTAASRALRFALCACFPGLAILSLAATSRGIYAAPVIPGISLLVAVALTAADSDPAKQGIVRTTVRWTAWTVLLMDGGILAAIVALHAFRRAGDLAALLLAVAGLAIVIALCVRELRALRRPAGEVAVEAAITGLAAAHVTTLIAAALSLFPLLNRSQDLQRIAAFIQERSGDRPMVLWLPDETTLAMSDLYLRKPVCSILLDVETEQQRVSHLARCLQEYPGAAVVAEMNCSPKECDPRLGMTTNADPMQKRTLDLQDATLSAAGVHPVEGIVRPGGRAYLVGFRAP